MELRDYLRTLSKRRWLVIACVVVVVAISAVATALTPPSYEASAKLFVGQRQVSSTDVSQGYQISQLSLTLLKSYAAIIKTRPIAEHAVENDNLPLSPSALGTSLVADPVLDTQLIKLTYRSNDAELAQRVVNAVADAFVREVARIETPREQGSDPAVKVSVVEPAMRPSSPVLPQPRRNITLATMLGLMLGAAIALLLDYLDTTVKGPEDAENVTGLPVLAAIPRVQTDGRGIHVERDPQSGSAEAFRKLRTAVQFLGVDRPLQTILVTSPFAQDGKTTTCINLAAAFAQAGLRTLIVEADLRRPVLHEIFPSDGQRGLTTLLIGRIPLEQAILPTPIRNLSHIPAGAVPPNPSELLASQHMADVLNRLRAQVDIVVIDAPPILPVTDAAALAPRADGVLLVVRSASTSRERLREASALVGKVGGRLVGVVLNYLKVGQGDSGYYDYYGYASRRDASPFQMERPGERLRSLDEGKPT